jgi:hypothetical protein
MTPEEGTRSHLAVESDEMPLGDTRHFACGGLAHLLRLLDIAGGGGRQQNS